MTKQKIQSPLVKVKKIKMKKKTCLKMKVMFINIKKNQKN